MVFNLYRHLKDSVTGGYHDCGYFETDAPKEVIEKIVDDIKDDNKVAIKDFSDSVATILKARGYTCEKYNIEKFGYSN